MELTEEQIMKCSYMLGDLQSRRLVVVKLRTDEGWKRIPTETNADWYQEFCEMYMTRMRRYPKQRTFIKRCHTVRVLKLLSNGVSSSSIYVERLIPLIEAYSIH